MHQLGPVNDVRLHQLDVPGAANEHPPLRTVSRSISNLPAQRGELRGRTGATVEVRRLLARNRMVTLTGAGGIGKTRLAVHVAGQESLGAQDAVYFVDLAALAVDVDVSFLAALGLSPVADQGAVHQVEQLLLGRRALLVVDNCEHVLDAVADLLDRLLDRLPDLTVLATSREPIGLPGERVWRVPPLSTRSGGPAVRLFEERATAVASSFTVDDSNVDAVVDLCRRLDGLPLAIELAASRMHTMSVDDVASHLDDRLRLLRSVGRGRAPRQRTIEEVVAWSYDLCSADEQTMLQRLVVFPSSFARDDVAGVTGFDPLDAVDVFDSLVTKSIVQIVELPGGRLRYLLLESIRDFGRSRHADESVLTAARDRHLAHFLTTQGAPTELSLDDITARIQLPEFDNIRAAADWALQRGDRAAATSLTIGRTMAIVEHGGADRAIDWLAGREELGTNDQLWALNGCAYVAYAQGDHRRVAAFTKEAVELAGGRPFDAMPNLYCFASLDEVIDDPQLALSTVERALAVAPDTPSGAAHLPMIHYTKSALLLHASEFDAALREAEVAQRIAGPRSPYWGVAMWTRLATFLATDADDDFASALASVQRPARWGAHEWMYRLFDLALSDPSPGDIADRARAALAPQGGHPVQRSRDLLAILAVGRLRTGDLDEAARYATAGLSGSLPGAVAFDAVARFDGGGLDKRTRRRELGSRVRQPASRDRALELARRLASGEGAPPI